MTADNPYENGQQLATLFGRFEHALKRNGFLKSSKHAAANWEAFANSIGEDFFAEVKRSGIANTLIKEPPRTLMTDGLRWAPEQPKPLENVVDLFVRGVCKVRNSYIHGEKFVSGEATFARDALLVREALLVLELAEKKFLN